VPFSADSSDEISSTLRLKKQAGAMQRSGLFLFHFTHQKG
jgi:hypothetical protein